MNKKKGSESSDITIDDQTSKKLSSTIQKKNKRLQYRLLTKQAKSLTKYKVIAGSKKDGLKIF